jgi:DNA-binding NtrC family response regulator
MKEEPIKLLLVDDEDNFRQFTSSLLYRHGFAVTEASGGQQAVELVKKNSYDMVLLDLAMPEMGGLEVMSRVKQHDSTIEIVILTGEATIDSALDAMKKGAYDYLRKPIKIEELETVLKNGYKKKRFKQDNEFPGDEFSKFSECCKIVGKSIQTESIRSFVLMAADSNLPVLILGETGTGKELVAQGIYQHSGVSGEFVAINSGGVPDELLASELFGHKKGAFTGAHEDKKGLVELADGGVLFIDEIGEMSFYNQVSLLRFLERGVFRPLGTNRESSVNIRVIAATNRNLEQEVKEGKFREDLFYRLNVLSIELPPLRERKEDILELAYYFLSKLNKEYNRQITFDSNIIKNLLEYDWPGNIRELLNTISRGFAVSRTDTITSFDLSDQNKRAPQIPLSNLPSLASIEENEQSHLARVLSHTGWNKAETIRILGITYPRLQRLIAKYGLKKE